MPGVFTISLDFELHWGVFDKKDRHEMYECYQNTLALIPSMLGLFEAHGVHVTWAVVGSLYANNMDEWLRMRPSNLPTYIKQSYSAYQWVEKNGLPEEYSSAHFAPVTIKEISKYAGQEIGSHTFAHYYCLEELCGDDAFNDDLTAAREIAHKNNNHPVSLVFPRNQFNPLSLDICYANGIRAVRSNPPNWFWQPIPDKGSTLTRKLFRSADAYISIGNGRTSYPVNAINKQPGKPIQLPASRFLRSWQPRYGLLNKLRIKRVINELRLASENGECYHLWWHPENFGINPQENMNDLVVILDEYSRCKNKEGMQSWNMGEYVQHLS